MADLVANFEKQLAASSEDLQSGWADLVQGWLTSPSYRLNSYARTVLQHERWDPPKWWVAHNARICRPCLYFPRGKCENDECGYCHGPDHPKPKRPAKNKRASARRRFGRTPSPSPEPRMFAASIANESSGVPALPAPPLAPQVQITQPEGQIAQPLVQLPAPVASAAQVAMIAQVTPVLVWTPAIAAVYVEPTAT
mmetsp:Transcript_128959/g.210177  ORF Transcript_128959/g.210177 Transcript_128959/m.210177 type:complete len:196 (-) Transcript_128959:53-640(-)